MLLPLHGNQYSMVGYCVDAKSSLNYEIRHWSLEEHIAQIESQV
jgi:hypothetical protein